MVLETPCSASGLALTLLLLTLTTAAGAARLDDPIGLGTGGTPHSAYRVTVLGSLAYVAAGGSGLRIVDVVDPSATVEVGSIDTPSYAFDVDVVGGFAYVADGASGLRVIDRRGRS